ncbi:interleukin-1 receptor-associated kinase 4-like [Mercenaria mercenaria]|uniref:interleukin-1 receptor-associated kinase 4-like n=1 Tax=Mercenaria mercenaria TaxID=6596 RepID=UPI00234F4A47|nr:interleukin-1 receptor-associated kinase 4-like [Mercenaria mercenaria]
MTGGSSKTVTEETYIRQLPYSVVKYISLLLDVDRQWEKFVLKIPKRLHDVGRDTSEMRYSYLQVRLFEDKSKRPDGSPTKTIMDDWGTQNTKVKHLLRILQEAALYEAADYISENVLHQGKVPRLQEETENTASLPAPSWDDKKLKDSDNKQVQEKDNFDAQCQKNIYEREKPLGNAYSNGVNSPTDSTYNRLMKPGEDEWAYNKLSPGVDKAIYYRTPSFDSGGSFSDVLKAGNKHDAGVEHEEETVQIRSFKERTAVKANDEDAYSYAYSGGPKYAFAKEVPEPRNGSADKIALPPRKREPCETTDESEIDVKKQQEPCESSDGSASKEDDLYKVIANQKLTYHLLGLITDDFNQKPVALGGRVVGSGGFGDVYLGRFENGFQVAVKRLKNVEEVDKQFETELDSLIKYRHRNIVRLYGFSIDGPGKCLVYEYLCNGSLEDRLLRRDNTPPLPNDTRLTILKGTAEGINFLNKQGTVHRDIKSANVLLDDKFEPKVGDFATARSGPRGNSTMPMSTQVVIGTSAYLAPEAMNFDVSTKLDSYSFGIVILEILTALPPLDHDREEKDLKSHVEENHITDMLDTSGGKWMDETVAKLVEISEKCTQIKKKYRVNVADILPELLAIK